MFLFINFLNFIINLLLFISPLCGWSKLPTYSFSTIIWYFVLLLVFTIISFYLFILSILEFIDDIKSNYCIKIQPITSISNDLQSRIKFYEDSLNKRDCDIDNLTTLINKKDSYINNLTTLINKKNNIIKSIKEQNKYYVRTIKISKDKIIALKRDIRFLEDNIKSMGGNIYE